ncbi:hypothetical protein OAY09_02105 [Candidatus Pelagibacter sp.]|nr:hypothetical protein [Candidatus Pelagibacter sp.]
MNRLGNITKKICFIILAYLTLDIIFFSLLPNNIKTKIYNNRAHRIKSFYYHHDFRPNASFVDQWGFNKVIINTNNLGFKDSKIRDVIFKKKNILFIGDSFTEGVGLKFEDSYVGIISKKLKKKNQDIEVLNAAVQSYSPAIYLSKIYNILERKKMPITDIVIMVSGGDFHDDYFRYTGVDKNFIVMHEDPTNKYLIKLINFYKSHTLLYQFISRVTPIRGIPYLIKTTFFEDKKNLEIIEKNKSNKEILNMKFLKNKDFQYFYNDEIFNEWGKNAILKSLNFLERIIEITSKKNIKLTILYAKEPNLILKEPNQEVLNFILDKFKKLEQNNVKFYYINTYDSLYKDKFEKYKNLFYINDNHWNKKGNMLVSDEILKKIDFN